MKGYLNAAWTTLIVMVVLCLTLVTLSIQTDIAISNDIDGYLRRAESAPTARIMADMLENASKGLDKWDMHNGSWSLFYDHADCRMEYARQQIDALIKRCRSLETNQSIDNFNYTVSLNEMKSNFGKIHIDAYGWYTQRNAIWLYIPIFAMELILIIVVGIILMMWFGIRDVMTVPASFVCWLMGHNYGKEWQDEYEDDKDVNRYHKNCQRCDKHIRYRIKPKAKTPKIEPKPDEKDVEDANPEKPKEAKIEKPSGKPRKRKSSK